MNLKVVIARASSLHKYGLRFSETRATETSAPPPNPISLAPPTGGPGVNSSHSRFNEPAAGSPRADVVAHRTTIARARFNPRYRPRSPRSPRPRPRPRPRLLLPPPLL